MSTSPTPFEAESAVPEAEKPEEEKAAQVPQTPEGLEQKKREVQSFDVSGNHAGAQWFIQNLNLGDPQPYREVANPRKSKKGKRFDLEKPEDCAKFVEEYRNGEYLALAVTLAVFDVAAITDLPNMAKSLIAHLPAVEEETEEGAPADPHRHDPYLSLHSKLDVVGARMFVQDSGESCVGFGSRSSQVLLNIWNQFPALRAPIVSWLVELSRTHPYRTTFDTQQVIRAFCKVVALDFEDAKGVMFERLYSHPENMGFLGTLACALLQDPAVKDGMRPVVLGWAQSESPWLWKSALFAYAGVESPEGYAELKPPLRKKLQRQMASCGADDAFLLSMISSRSVHVRTLLCEALSDKLSDAAFDRTGRDAAAQFYWMLVSSSYYLVGRDAPRLSFVVCDTREQQHLLSPVLAHSLSGYDRRKRLFMTLSLYLKEASGYTVSSQLVKHTAAYFSNMMQSAPAYREDIVRFLEKCSCGLARDVLKLLRGRPI